MNIAGKSLWWHCKLWINQVRERLVDIDPITQAKFDIKYHAHKKWLKYAWRWNPDEIKAISTYSIGNCSDCKHFEFNNYMHIIYNIKCKKQSFQNQRKYDWNLPPTQIGLTKVTCNLFDKAPYRFSERIEYDAPM